MIGGRFRPSGTRKEPPVPIATAPGALPLLGHLPGYAEVMRGRTAIVLPPRHLTVRLVARA